MNSREKENILKEVYKYLKNNGYRNFKSNLLKFDEPNKFVEKQTGDVFEPDLIATYNSGLYLFEVETVESIKERRENFISKCRTFLHYAHSKNGKLTLIIPEQQSDQVISELNKVNLENIGILQINYS